VARPGRPTVPITLSENERATLQRWSRRHSSSQAWRCAAASCWRAQKAPAPTPRSRRSRLQPGDSVEVATPLRRRAPRRSGGRREGCRNSIPAGLRHASGVETTSSSALPAMPSGLQPLPERPSTISSVRERHDGTVCDEPGRDGAPDQAALSYSWMRPPRASRRRTTQVDLEGGPGECCGSGVRRSNPRWGRLRL
jgi:hypothetical protein